MLKWFKRKPVIQTPEALIEGAQKEYDNAVKVFKEVQEKIKASNGVLDNTVSAIDAQIDALVAQRVKAIASRERNVKQLAKLDEFLN